MAEKWMVDEIVGWEGIAGVHVVVDDPGEHGFGIVCYVGMKGCNQTSADKRRARLIAAAPELLAACQLALEKCDLGEYSDVAEDAVKAAVAKATEP